VPYIHQNLRNKVTTVMGKDVLPLHEVESAGLGGMAYIFTMLLLHRLNYTLECGYTINYERLIKWHGMLQSVADEFKRRVIDVYEEKQEHDNGDVGYGDLVAKICKRSS